jgi:ATP-binding cassette subfamily F protein uup
VDRLSGGELKRLYLCTVLIQNPNFLILDEPTNDLDIVTRFRKFPFDYPGCLLVVSHDRYFMDKIVDHLFILEVMEWSKIFRKYSDFRAYEDSTELQKRKHRKRMETKQPTGNLTFNEQKKYQKIEKKSRI